MNLRALFPLLLLPLTVSAIDWSQYRGPNGDGSTIARVVRLSPPKQVWKVPSEGGFSSFVTGGNRVFTLSLKEIEGAKQEALVALDANTGRELWSAPLNFAKYDGGGDSGAPDNKGGDGPRSTPAVDGARVYAYSSQMSLRAFDAATGKIVWTHDVVKENNGRNIQWENATSPLIEGGLIYVAGGGQGESILAINPKDGSVSQKAFDEKMTHATPVAATILGQRQIIFFLQSGLLSVEPGTLKELWRYAFDYKTSTAASPVVSNDIVYCAAGYGVGAGAVRIAKQGSAFTATELYRSRGNKPICNHWSTPVAKDGYLYGMFQFKEYAKGPLKCVDIATGQVKWEKEGFGPGQVILAGDQVLALSDRGDLVLIATDPAAYKEVARAHVLEGKCWTTPIVANGRIYARSTKEAVCIDVSGR
jgi:outer membrane protein assembly factor BamB